MNNVRRLTNMNPLYVDFVFDSASLWFDPANAPLHVDFILVKFVKSQVSKLLKLSWKRFLEIFRFLMRDAHGRLGNYLIRFYQNFIHLNSNYASKIPE